jgi:ubiquinone/menaquinone biosynthesis C-methylase UbiE
MTTGSESSRKVSAGATVNRSDVVQHFTARAVRYDRSSRWCSDEEMMQVVMRYAEPRLSDRTLDVACGTGLVSRALHGKVSQVVGLDLTPAMCIQALPFLEGLVLGAAEAIPFQKHSFDLVVCRQGIQFMDAASAVREMIRVTRKDGRVVVVNLCAYSEEDRAEYFEILHLRNPARRNFFMLDDLASLLTQAGCENVQVHSYVIPEDIDLWADNGAIPQADRERIHSLYCRASEGFRRLHEVQYLGDGRIVDNMLFGIAVGSP